MQRVVYNGHKRVHAFKLQSVVTPNGNNSKIYIALLKDIVMTVACLHTLVSCNNLNETLITYIKNQCAYMATQPIHYVPIYKDLLPTQLLTNLDTTKPSVSHLLQLNRFLVISQMSLLFLI